MLLAQPFDPIHREQTQQKKMSFLARCRFMSQSTRRVLCNLKNRARDNRFMLNPPPPPLPPQPQPWYCSFGGCYDPYLVRGPPPASHPMHFPPMLSHQSMPYSICVHLTTPLQDCNNRHHQQQPQSSSEKSTLCSSKSSLFNTDEKEQTEYDFHQDKLNQYVKRRRSGSNITAAPSTLTRSNSDIQQRRPYMQHKWNSQNKMYYD